MTQGAPNASTDDSGAQAQTPLQRAVAALAKMKARLDALEAASSEPIAVIGIGCRFPGGGDDPAAFWEALEKGVDGIREIPPERWPHDTGPSALPETKWAGLIDHFDTFDAAFFGIAPREAESLDPQQRLLLEVAWEALEDAGIRPSKLEGSKTGVFVGATSLDYRELMRDRRAGSFDAYCTTGNLLATAAGRVSYTLGLHGPAIVSDTACSSSLVSIHLACASLRARECDLALAGGVNMLLSPAGMALAAATQALSADGRCRTLDAHANGFVRAEGCGLVALKRRSDAERDGDRVLALIVGSAINQDGRSTGLTAPNVLAQQALIRQALDNAKLSPADIGYVEMHGTGTVLGDPIELEGLRAVLGQPRSDGSACVLGSVKTYIGHLESAAGAAGLIKAVLCLNHSVIPRNLHFRTLNPRISLRGTPFVVPSDNLPWPRADKPRRAGVSSFGISGTNAHVLLQEAPPAPVTSERGTESGCHLVPVSGRSPEALAAQARALAERLEGDSGARLSDVAYTASVRRDHHRYRATVVSSSTSELGAALRKLGEGEPQEGAARGEASVSGRPKVVFVLPGQGSQWLGMGRELLATEPAFRAALEACDEVVRREGGFSILEQIQAEEAGSRMAEIDVVQPLLFAMEVALGALWQSWGVLPDEIVGHSMGEVAAAHLAGVLTLEDAAKVICRRSRLLRRQSGRGAMALVELTRDELQASLRGREQLLGVAVSNGPRATVVSGDPRALDDLLGELERRGIFCRRVKVDVASHSPQMDELTEELLAALQDVRPQKGRVPMRSTVTGNLVEGPEMTASYWVQNLRQPVLFSTAVTRLLGDVATLFVELSPHPLLLPSIVENVAESGRAGAAFGSTRRKLDERRAMLETLGELHVRGVAVEWASLFPQGGELVRLPTYRWTRERHWLNSTEGASGGAMSFATAGAGHPLVGQVLIPSDRANARYWEQWISPELLPYLADHRVQGAVVFPASGYVEMALAAASAAFGGERLILENIVLDQVLHLAENEPRRVQLAVIGEEGVQASIVVSSRESGSEKWTRHGWATARAALADDALWQPPKDIVDRCPHVIEAAEHYARMAARRIDFGPAFQGLERVWVGEGEAMALVRLPEAAGSAAGYQLHPALLDACLQAAGALFEGKAITETWVPAAIDRLQFLETLPAEAWVHVRWSAVAKRDGITAVDLLVTDEEGRPLLSIERMWLQRLARLELPDAFSGCVYVTDWLRSPLPFEHEPPAEGTWIILTDDGGLGRGVAAALRGKGHRCIEVTPGPGYRAIDSDHLTIDPTSSDHFERIVRDAIAGDRAVRGILHLWSLDALPFEDSSPETILADMRMGSLTVLHAAHGVTRCALRDPPRLVLVTRGAQAAGSDASLRSPSQAALWGFARVLSVEHPELGCVRIDLDPDPRANEIEVLLEEIRSRGGEDQIAFRGDERLVARLQRDHLDPADPPAFHADGTYLITGGLTGLGLALAGWMVRQGARNLMLLGRRGPSETARQAISEMEQVGASIHVLSVDVSVPEDLARALAHISQNMPPLRGVVHSAAVLEDHSIFEMVEQTFWPPILAKSLGAWNLHTQLRSTPLDFFILYSSGATLLGSPGQANYAAANAFVDALSHVRWALGLPATSIQWGPFSEVGLAAASDNRGQRLSLRGILSFTPEEGHKLISRLIKRPLAEVGLLRLSVRQLFDFYPRMALAPFLEGVRQDDATAQTRQTTDARFRTLLAETAPSRRRGALEQHLIEHIERVLRLPAGRIDPQWPFLSYGMDSLMSLEIRHRLEASLNLRLSAAVLYTYPNVAALVDHLLEEMQLETTSSQSCAAAEPTGFHDIVDELSDNTAAAMLDEKLLDLEDYLK